MKAISIKQPWASLICTPRKDNPTKGIKDIENRSWKLPEKYIGQRVLIHASGKPDKEPYMLFNDDQINCIGDRIMDVCASYHLKSAIIGSVQLVGCEINHPSTWAEKSTGVFVSNTFVHKPEDKPIYNWILANHILFPEPIPCKGKLSFWDYPGIINDNEYLR